MTYFYSIFEDYENMANEHRNSHEFLDDSATYLTPYNGEKGKAKILWENKRKDEYRNWLIAVSCCAVSSTRIGFNTISEILDSSHTQRWHDSYQDKGGCRMGYCRVSGHSRHASDWDSRISSSISLTLPRYHEVNMIEANTHPSHGNLPTRKSRARLNMPFKPSPWMSLEPRSNLHCGSALKETRLLN